MRIQVAITGKESRSGPQKTEKFEYPSQYRQQAVVDRSKGSATCEDVNFQFPAVESRAHKTASLGLETCKAKLPHKPSVCLRVNATACSNMVFLPPRKFQFFYHIVIMRENDCQ